MWYPSSSQNPGWSWSNEFETAHPFGAFPEIEMRNQQPSRTAVFGGERLAFVAGRDHPLAADEILDGKIGHVAAVAMNHGEWGGRF